MNSRVQVEGITVGWSSRLGARAGNCARRQRTSRPVSGFALIEVLIAVVVLSVGILGILALQLNALAYSYSAYMTSVASVQAMDLEERMRANTAALDTYVDIDPAAIDTTVPLDTCQSGGCGAEALAEYDMHRWVVNTRRLFPATLDITLETSGAGVYELALSWAERGRDDTDEESDTARSLHYLFRLDAAAATSVAGAT